MEDKGPILLYGHQMKTDEIMGKLHRLIGNKTDTEALREIKIAMDLFQMYLRNLNRLIRA